MGVPKKPRALREAHGTAHRNKHRDNSDAPVPQRGIGPAPKHFDIFHAAVWDEIVNVSHPGVLAEPDRIALEMATVLLFRFRFGGQTDQVAPLTGVESNQLIGLLARFGMTPADRNKVSAPEAGKGKGTFGRF